MNILVANDDGIESRGIHELVRALSTRANVYVVAPESQRSASGHGITISKPIIVEKVHFSNAAAAWQISGTPADCVKLGVQILSKKKTHIDMIFAGINHGANLGNDTLYSGTVSAALEGLFCGFPSVAVSVCSHQAEHFEFACEQAIEAVKEFEREAKSGDNNSEESIFANNILNINVPNVPYNQVKGVKYASLGTVKYKEYFDVKALEDGKHECYYGGEPILDGDNQDGTDVSAINEGYAVITPIQSNLTAYHTLEIIRNRRNR